VAAPSVPYGRGALGVRDRVKAAEKAGAQISPVAVEREDDVEAHMLQPQQQAACQAQLGSVRTGIFGQNHRVDREHRQEVQPRAAHG